MHSDVVGPLPDPYSGAHHFLPFIDEWSRFIVANPIRTKEEKLKRFKAFDAHFEKQYEAIIKSILSDNGGEYTPVNNMPRKREFVYLGLLHILLSPTELMSAQMKLW
jgi:hypothetical protein